MHSLPWAGVWHSVRPKMSVCGNVGVREKLKSTLGESQGVCELVSSRESKRVYETSRLHDQLQLYVSPPSDATAVTAPVCPVFRVVVAGRYLVCRFN